MKKSCDLLDLHALLGKKWTCTLLHNLHPAPTSYNTLHRLFERRMNTTLLSERLKELIKFKVIHKEEHGYSITAEGEKLKSIISQTKEWVTDNNFNLPTDCDVGKCVSCEKFN